MESSTHWEEQYGARGSETERNSIQINVIWIGYIWPGWYHHQLNTQLWEDTSCMMKWDRMFQKLPAGYIKDLGGARGSHSAADQQPVNSHQDRLYDRRPVERPGGETTLRTQVTSHKNWLSDQWRGQRANVPVVWGLLLRQEGLEDRLQEVVWEDRNSCIEASGK